MPITALNSQEFAKDLAQQALSYVPADLTEEQKTYVAKKVFDFSIIAGNHLIERYNQEFNDEQARIIVQFIGEWTFHKSIDTIRAKIPTDHWDEILQQVAFSALQTAIQSFSEGIDQIKIAVNIEVQVNGAYEACIKKLASSGVIPEEQVKEIMSYSNVDKMAKESGANVVEDEEKILKYAAIAIVLKQMSKDKVESLLANFEEEEQKHISTFLKIEDIEQKVNPIVVAQYLAELKKNVAGIAKPKISNTITGIKALQKKYQDEEIFDVLSYERSRVLDFMEKILFESSAKASKIEFSPYIAKILYNHLRSNLATQG